MGKRMDMRRWAVVGLVTLPPLFFLTAMVLAPLWAMAAYDGLAWGTVLSDAYMLERLAWTVFQAAATCILVLPLGVPVAWVLARLAFPGRTFVLRLLMLPFVMPTLVAGVGVLAFVRGGRPVVARLAGYAVSVVVRQCVF